MQKQWLCAVVLIGLTASNAFADNDCSNASPAQAKALATKAAAQLEKLGPREAFEQFMDPEGDYFPRDLYVFVVDFDGLMWVNGAFPMAVGSNAMDAEDSKGRRYIQQMLRVAKQRGEGAVEYQWVNPCTGVYSDKITFFKRVGPYVVAVGAYGSITTQRNSAPSMPPLALALRGFQ